MSRELLGTLTWLTPLPPLLAFGIIALFTNRYRQTSSTIAVLAMALSLVLSFIVFFNALGLPDLGANPIRSVPYRFLPTGDTTLNIGAVVDPLGATFLFMVPLTCTLIFIYSIGYMATDPLYARFFAFLSLFGGSMMGLVVSDNLLLLFIFWELMGFCSYALIGFFYRRRAAYRAAVKAFMTTRIGDMLLLLGMVYLYSVTGTLNFYDILHNQQVLTTLATMPSVLGLGISAAGLIAMLIFGGTVGKSAQFPLHVWLPDAMEGPTPVSAMIHAATMVSAGIFLLLRFFPLLQVGGRDSLPFIVVGAIGAITALLGATIALAQHDIKRVLAFSTISQLGFMVAAVGIGAYMAALFHLLAHAFFKALLFLGSGSVIHGVEHGHGQTEHAAQRTGLGHEVPTFETPSGETRGHGESAPGAAATDGAGTDSAPHGATEFDAQDMRNMGGLRKRMPITFWTFLAGGLALASFPIITAGFWSKDEILGEAFYGLTTGSTLSAIVFIVLAVSALLTAFYIARQISLTFLGQPRTEAAANASESPFTMTFPLIVLAAFAILFGFTNVPPDFPVLGPLFYHAAGWLQGFVLPQLVALPAFNIEPLPFNWFTLVVSFIVALGGLGLGFWVYAVRPLRAGQTDPVESLGVVYKFLYHRWYFDELYRAVLINPLQWVADNYTRIVDKGIIDPILEGVVKLGVLLARGFKEFDRVVITGGSDLIGNTVRDIGREGRELQTGQVQNYLLSALIAAVVLIVFFLVVAQ